MKAHHLQKHLPAKYRHIIWDWNGTILDDAWLCVEILNQMLEKRGMRKTTLADYQQFFDFPVIKYYRTLGFDFQKEDFDTIAQEYIRAYESQYHRCSLRSGIVDVIKELRSAGFLQSVLSASEGRSLNRAVERFGLKDYFENIAGLNDYYARSKVEAGLKLLENLTDDKSKLLLIGDTTHDYEVAVRLGVDCFLLPAGHQSRQRLLACGATVCEDLSEILEILFYCK